MFCDEKITKRTGGMIDVSLKKENKRIAKAQATVKLKKEVLDIIKNNKAFKGDVLECARIAAISASKKTSDLIPLCHPLRITEVKISFVFIKDGIRIRSLVSAIERTGVEMEAMVACSVCALTIYDMCKMYDRSIEITDIMLIEKQGGKNGIYKRER
ncbi:MAG: cyclic pyranopterin monophosphate synthase MoaC [Candidatus Omnitrophota bacterium]